MLISFDSLWAQLGSVSFYTAIVPFVTGGIGYFRPWLVDEKEIRDRSDFIQQERLERINKKLQLVLGQLDSDVNDRLRRVQNASEPLALEPADLRGAGHATSPDYIADFTEEFAGGLADIGRMRSIYLCLRRCRTIFLYTALAGLALFVVALLFEASRPYVAIVSLLIISLHGILAIMARRWTTQIDQCEGRP